MLESSSPGGEGGLRKFIITSLIGAIILSLVGLGFAYLHRWLGIGSHGEPIASQGSSGEGTKDKGREAPPELPRGRVFRDPHDVLTAIAGDLEKVEEPRRARRRYLTLTHLHNNPQVSNERLEEVRQTLGAFAGYLSPEGKVAVWSPVDPEQTIFAVDLQELGWDEDAWRALIRGYPYGLTFTSSSSPRWKAAAEVVSRLVETRIFSVRADWLMTAVLAPSASDTIRVPGGRAVPEGVQRLAQEYPRQQLTLEAAASELAQDEPGRLRELLERNAELRQSCNLEPLTAGGHVLRSTWESTEGATSPFQQVSEALQMGRPVLAQ